MLRDKSIYNKGLSSSNKFECKLPFAIIQKNFVLKLVI